MPMFTRRSGPAKGQVGGLLVECLVGLAIVGTVGVSVLRAVQTSYTTKSVVDAETTADLLLRNQMESVFAEAYKLPGGSYGAVNAPEGFSIVTEVLPYQEGTETITTVRVVVYHHGDAVRTLETLRSYR